MLVEMTRHGARAPEKGFMDVPWVKKEYSGELTSVGQRQHYNLGRIMALKYKSFFDRGLGHEEYWIRSTDYNRTIMSAFSHMFGLTNELSADELPFENENENLLPPLSKTFAAPPVDFKTALPGGVVPFPIHTRLRDHEVDMRMFGKTCPNIKKRVDSVFEKLNEELVGLTSFTNLMTEARKRFNLQNDETFAKNDFWNCWSIADFMVQDNNNSRTPFVPRSDPFYNRLARCYYIGILYRYKEQDIARIQSTPILNQILDFF